MQVDLSVVSVIYNRSYEVLNLVESLDHIDSKSHLSIEHIVQDGGSEDGTIKLFNENNRSYRKVHSQRDGGIYDALNIAFNRCNGRYLMLLHAGDLIHPKLNFQELDRIISEQEFDVLAFGVDFYNSNKEIVRSWSPCVLSDRQIKLGKMLPHTGMIISRDFWYRTSGFDTSLKISADYKNFLEIWALKPKIYYSAQYLVSMSTGGASSNGLMSYIRSFNEDYKAVKNLGYKHALWMCLNKKFHKIWQLKKLGKL